VSDDPTSRVARVRELAVTLPDREHSVTIPAPPALAPVDLEQWNELYRAFSDLDANERRLVIALVQRMRGER
jgi:hypothetical protein